MSPSPSLRVSLTRLWLRWYTAGLPPQLRQDRRCEITSDMAEHSSSRMADGWGSRRIARERLTRTLLGVPADLRWRREVLVAPWTTAPRGPLRAAWTWTRDEWPTLAGIALGAFYLVFSLYVAGLGAFEEAPVLRLFSVDELSGRTVGAAFVFLIGLGVIVASFARLLVSTVADVVLIWGAVLAMPFYWMVLPTLLAVVVILGAGTDLVRPKTPRPSTRDG